MFFLFAILLGLSLVTLCLGWEGREYPALGLRVGIALVLGPLVAGGVYWWALAVGCHRCYFALLCASIVLTGGPSLWIVFNARSRPNAVDSVTGQPGESDYFLDGAFDWALVVGVAIAFAGVVAIMWVIPLGDWDAWASWNVKARFLADPATWTRVFDPALAYTRPNYPLLLPATTQSAVTLSAGPWTVRLVHLFFAGSILVMAGSAAGTRSALGRRLLLLLLLSTPFFVRHLASQYADVPLCALVFASIVLSLRLRALPLRGTLLLGLMAGLLPLIKDEGSLYLIGVTLFAAWRLRRDHLPRRALLFVGGAIAPLLGLLLHKIGYAPQGALFERPLAQMWHDFSDPERWRVIFHYLYVEFIRFNRWLIWMPLCSGALVFSLRRPRHALPLAVLTTAVLLAFVVVFLIAPVSPLWHLVSTSWPRLLFQLWPLAALVTAQVLEQHERFLPQWLMLGLPRSGSSRRHETPPRIHRLRAPDG